MQLSDRMRLLGRGWYESLIGASEKPPALPEDIFFVAPEAGPVMHILDTSLHFRLFLCVCGVALLRREALNQDPRGIDWGDYSERSSYLALAPTSAEAQVYFRTYFAIAPVTQLV